MSDLTLEGDALQEVARSVRAVVADFRAAGGQARDAAQHVGHGGLAHRVIAFADQWDIHCARTTQLLDQLADAFDAVNDTFADLDRDGAARLRAAGPAAVGLAAPAAETGAPP